MSSLKMTFSLASLVLIIGLVFATAPVMAQSDIDQIVTFTNTAPVGPDGTTSIAALATGGNVQNIAGAVSIPPGGYLILTKAEDC